MLILPGYVEKQYYPLGYKKCFVENKQILYFFSVIIMFMLLLTDFKWLSGSFVLLSPNSQFVWVYAALSVTVPLTQMITHNHLCVCLYNTSNIMP